MVFKHRYGHLLAPKGSNLGLANGGVPYHCSTVALHCIKLSVDLFLVLFFLTLQYKAQMDVYH